jgi:hypothetical protein
VLQLGVQPVDDGVKGHGVLRREDHQLEVRVADLEPIWWNSLGRKLF